MLEKILSKSFIKFIIIGGCSTLIDFIAYSFLMNYIHVLIAKSTSMIISSVFSYWFNKKWTFDYEKKTDIRILIRYYLTLGINIGTNTFINWQVLNITNNKYIAFVVATGIAMIVNYLLQHFFVFRENDKIIK